MFSLDTVTSRQLSRSKDLLFMSLPNAMLKRMHLDATKEIARRDTDLLAGLEKAGFKLDQGPDDAGFFMK